MARLFFTSGNNGPSGGGRVLNDVVNLARDNGHEAWLCLPRKHCDEAAFVENPAPVFPLEEVVAWAGPKDSVIVGWHTQLDYDLLRETKARHKVFWQHGTLVPLGPGLVGEKIFEPGLFTQYWNVSKSCGLFIKNKYGLADYKLVPPFFRPYINQVSTPLPWRKRRGILVQQRRGFELLSGIERVAQKHRENVTVLKAPFHNSELLEALNTHKYFVSFDRGLRYRPNVRDRLSLVKRAITVRGITPHEAIFPKPKWVKHETTMLGFPISAAQAARQECAVIGFAMGGGLEWMSAENIYLAKDGDSKDLFRQLDEALGSSEQDNVARVQLASLAIDTFTPENTWEKISTALTLS